MNKEVISDKQGISIISLFIMGSSLILITGGQSKKDVWIAIILAILTALPIVLVHARFLVLFPGRDLYDILEIVFGKYIGKGIIVLFVSYTFFLAGLVLRVFGDFISVVSLQQTPKIIAMCMIGFLCIWAAKEGIETIGRCAKFFNIVIISFILIGTLLLTKHMNINNLNPILAEGIKPVIKGTFQALIFPFTQTIVFTTFLSSLKSKSVYKTYLFGLLIGGLILYLISVCDILILGVHNAESMYFPSYAGIRSLKIRGISAGFEILFTSSFIIAGFIKVCMCLLSTCNGISKIFGFYDYRFIVTPIGLLVINLSYFIHDSVMEKAEFASDIYPGYAFPFQVILPILILIVAEIKKKRLANIQ